MTADERDRDERGRPHNARPRDALGRPLPRGATPPTDASGPEPAVGSHPAEPSEVLRSAQQLLDAGRPFQAHEVFEDAWKLTAGAERELWRALAQLAVGITHLARGNPRGAQALLRRAALNLGPYRERPPHGVDVDGLIGWAEATDRALIHGADPGPPPPVATGR